MAGRIGWRAVDLREASLAEFFACYAGHERAQGRFRDEGEPMTRARAIEMVQAANQAERAKNG